MEDNQVLILIHRSYSSRAASEMPSNPLKHRFGPSVLATFKCATVMADLMTDFLEHQPVWVGRIYPIWAMAFSAAAAIGSLVMFAPRWCHASKALMHLDKICTFFENAEPTQVQKYLVKSFNRGSFLD